MRVAAARVEVGEPQSYDHIPHRDVASPGRKKRRSRPLECTGMRAHLKRFCHVGTGGDRNPLRRVRQPLDAMPSGSADSCYAALRFAQ